MKIKNGYLKIPQVGLIKASIHRLYEGKIKTVTISKKPSGKYYASILFDTEQEYPETNILGSICGIDFGIKDFCIIASEKKVSKYANPMQIKKHERNLARKQQKLARKQKGSKNRDKARQ